MDKRTLGVLGLIMKPFSYLIHKCKARMDRINADILWTITRIFEFYFFNQNLNQDAIIERLDNREPQYLVNFFDSFAWINYRKTPEILVVMRKRASRYLKEA